MPEGFDPDYAVVFKHSRACGNSRSVLELVLGFALRHPGFRFYLVSVLDFPTLSRFIETQTGVRHQTPQVLVLGRGEVFAHAAHGNITPNFLAKICSEEATNESSAPCALSRSH